MFSILKSVYQRTNYLCISETKNDRKVSDFSLVLLKFNAAFFHFLYFTLFNLKKTSLMAFL